MIVKINNKKYDSEKREISLILNKKEINKLTKLFRSSNFNPKKPIYSKLTINVSKKEFEEKSIICTQPLTTLEGYCSYRLKDNKCGIGKNVTPPWQISGKCSWQQIK